MACVSYPAWAAKSCEELKAEIEARLQAKGVAAYALEIVSAEVVKDAQIVGSCEGGIKKSFTSGGRIDQETIASAGGGSRPPPPRCVGK